MVVDDVVHRVVANLNRVIRLTHVRRAVARCCYMRMGKRLVNGFIYVCDKFIGSNRVEQMLLNVRNGTIEFVDECRPDVKRVLCSERRDGPSGF